MKRISYLLTQPIPIRARQDCPVWVLARARIGAGAYRCGQVEHRLTHTGKLILEVLNKTKFDLENE